MAESGSLMIRNLPLYGKICLAELALIAWGLQWFYERKPLPFFDIKFAVSARQTFYLVLPIALLPRVWRSYEDWFPIALLVSAGFATLLYRFVGSRPLQIEARMLIIVASAYAVVAILVGIPGEFSIAEALQLLVAGFMLLGGITILHGGFGWFSELDRPYSTATITLFHFTAASAFLICYQLTSSSAVSVTLLGSVYLTYVYFASELRPLRIQLGLHHLFAWGFSAFGLYLTLIAGGGTNQAIGFCLLLLNVTGLSFLCYGRIAVARLLRNQPLGIREKFLILHLLIFGTYVVFDKWIFGAELGPFTTLCMVLQATTILFQANTAPWKNSIQISKGLFGAVLLKIFLVDVASFSVFEKMLVFMGMGCLLLVSAYQYQKRQKAPSVTE